MKWNLQEGISTHGSFTLSDMQAEAYTIRAETPQGTIVESLYLFIQPPSHIYTSDLISFGRYGPSDLVEASLSLPIYLVLLRTNLYVY